MALAETGSEFFNQSSKRQHHLLIIGVGSIGERHLRCAQRTSRAKLSICEINPDLRQRVADKYQIEHVYSDLDSALAEHPTAAVVCVPAHLHVPFATKLVESGVHILIEKPLSTSLEGIERLKAAIKKHKVITAVAYIHRVNPVLKAMQTALQTGQFGKPVQLVASTGHDFAFHRPAYPSTYYRNQATGGGAIQDALTHVVNAAEWLIGPVHRVIADANRQLMHDVEVEDTVHLLARHGNTLASYTINQYQAPFELSITVVCERGTLRFEYHKNRWCWMTDPSGKWHYENGAQLERDDLFVAQLQSFFDAIEFSSPVSCTLDEGLQTLNVNLAILESVNSTRWTAVAGQENAAIPDVGLAKAV